MFLHEVQEILRRSASAWAGVPLAEEDVVAGTPLTRGTWMILDLYGTNHDPAAWDQPEQFSRERFRDWNGSAFQLVPQGGGDHDAGHRCAGEWITIELIKTAVRLLTTAMQYEVPEQDLSIDLGRIPALPASRFVVKNVRRI